MNYYNYFTEIEETFVRRRGKNLFLSPLDWALIESWQDRGIPLHIVIRSIESVFDVFDQQPAGTRTIKSLLYCKEEIEIQYREWAAAHAGSPAENEEADPQYSTDLIREHIAASVVKLETINVDPLREDIERAIARLRGLGSTLTGDLESVDGTLADIERVLDRAMLSNWDPEHLKALQKDIAGQLKAYKSEMNAESYQNTFDLMLLKRLREESGMPRLGLYYL